MTRWLRLCLMALAPVLSFPAANAEEPGFKRLFDGKSLDGWKKVGGEATYRIDGEDIVGEVGPGPNTFLRTEKEYGDFVLKLEFKLDIPGNSGIQIRSHQKDGDGRVFGYQSEIDPSDRAWTAGIYDEGRRGWVYSLENHPEARKALKKDDWNNLVIEARGPRIKTTLNDIPCADLFDATNLSGFIALQVHSGKSGKIRWRNIELKELGTTKWRPLWDGKSLEGWEKAGPGEWRVEDGVLRGTSPASEEKYSFLKTTAKFGDFAVRLKFKADAGNSGLFFRMEQKGEKDVAGYQAEIDAEKDVGGIYESGGRGWVVQPKPEDVKKFFKPGEWNDLSVIAIGGRIVVHVNGTKAAEVRDDEDGRKSGVLALQLHAKQAMDVSFKEIEIICLDDVECCD